MLTFVMLTRLSPDALRSPASLEELENQAMGQIRKEYPQVEGRNYKEMLHRLPKSA